MKKFVIRLSEEEKEAIKVHSHEVSDEELDAAAGGCCNVFCMCEGGSPC